VGGQGGQGGMERERESELERERDALKSSAPPERELLKEFKDFSFYAVITS